MKEKIEVSLEDNLKEIAKYYWEYMQKHHDCAARQTEGKREYCAVSPVGRAVFPCPYVDLRYSCFRKSEDMWYFGCAYLKKSGL